jgi:hypothetical protein
MPPPEFTVVIDHEAAPGNVVGPLAALLLSLARKSLAKKKSPANPCSRKENEHAEVVH